MVAVTASILIVDDDAKLRALLGEYLAGYGYGISYLDDGQRLLQTLEQAPPDMIVLDVMLPRDDGLDLLRRLRQVSAVPVIMLTAKGEEADRIVGLELGADDYLGKPFNPRELLARIRAVLRRRQGAAGPASPPPRPALLRAGGLELDPARRLLKVQGTSLELSLTETKVLEALMSHPNQVLSRDQLLNLARGREMMAFDRSIDVHISNLRGKLKPFAPFRHLIKTVWSAGYMFVENR
ncbi:MAG: response regulator [Desulfarculus sp.]|nr:response regulator [Desulfarculus sp.]